ncbi:hypothetical protein [Saccharopolyspora sp. NPDC049426]
MAGEGLSTVVFPDRCVIRVSAGRKGAMCTVGDVERGVRAVGEKVKP